MAELQKSLDRAHANELFGRFSRIREALTPASSDLDLLQGADIDIGELDDMVMKHRKVNIYRYPREKSKDGRQYWTYFAVIRYSDCWGILKGLTLKGIKTQIGRCANGLNPSDCSVCVYHRPKTPISPEHCHFTIDPKMTGFHGCPRFEVD